MFSDAKLKNMTFLNGKNPRSLVVIPVKNEASVLENVINEIKMQLSLPVVVVDDRSEDSSAAVAEKAGAIVVRLEIPLGPWGAIQTGLRFGLSEDYNFIATMDGDGQHMVDFLPALFNAVISDKADMAVGSFTDRLTLQRKAVICMLRHLGNLGSEDITSGMRVYNRKAMKLLVSDDAVLLDYPDFGIFTCLLENGLRIVEVPVRMRDRCTGKSRVFHSSSAVLSYLFYSYLLSLSKRK